jgi:hypothetical protein
MIMKKILLIVLALTTFALTASAQDGRNERPLESLRSDYNQVGVVAHVRVKNIKLAAPGIHSLYLLQGEVVESFKGRVRRGQKLDFYMSVEEGFDINTRLGDWIVFLEASSNTPNHKRGWFALENSSLPHSKKIVARMRKIKYADRRR